MQRRESNGPIDLLRFTAALVVVVNHARELLFRDYNLSPHTPVSLLFYTLAGLGRPAVYVFFALSGYWVGGWALHHLGRGTFSWRAHLVRRLSRLWTVLIPVLVLVAVIDVVGRHLVGGPYYAGSAAYNNVAPGPAGHLSVLTAIGNALFLQGRWVHTYGSDGPLWSLGYEFWYYLLFPAAFLALRRRSVTALGIVALAAVAGGEQTLLYFPAWLAGVGAYVVARRRAPAPSPSVILSLGLALVVTCAACQKLGLPGPVAALADATVCGLFLVASSRAGALRFGTWGASFSYSLYVVHLPVVVIACALLNRSGVKHPLGAHGLELFVAVSAAAVVAGWLTGRFVESRTAAVREVFERLSVRAEMDVVPSASPT
jgi:peptidoglycan/LPS O-acetylase OafA/YrhL